LLPLTKDESRRLKECERIIERGLESFYQVGNALAEIRDSRLYRISYASFEDYCRERWKISRFYAHRLIDAAQVVDNLLPIGNIPSNEAQARELAPFTPEIQKAVWHVAMSTAPTDVEGKPILTAAHIKSVGNVLTEVVKGGGLEDGSGEIKPLGVLIDAAVTEATYERVMRQKVAIKEKLEADTDASERKARQKSDRTEVEVLYEPGVQEKLTRYMDMVTSFENAEWPAELEYLRRTFQLHKAHANFQKTRNLHDDCEQILTVVRRLTPDAEAGITIAAQELYDWLFDLGYCMSKKEFTSRLEYMTQDANRMLLFTNAGEEGKQEDRRGKLPGIVCMPWKKIWKVSARCKRCKQPIPASATLCSECSGDEEDHY
jgi:hypothetical protein